MLFVTKLTTGTINLSTMIEFKTEIPECGANKLTSYLDSSYLTLSDVTNAMMFLSTNPSIADSLTGVLDTTIAYNFSASAVFPAVLSLRAETNDIGGAIPKVKDFTLTLKVCQL